MSPLRRETGLLVLAVTFLTRLPLRDPHPYAPARMAAAARYFALVGGVIGALAAGLWLAAGLVWSAPVAAILAIAFGILLTGALHEDGLCDSADGLGGGRTAARALEIMRDSRIGAYGALALIHSVGLRVALLAAMPPTAGAAALLGAHSASRAAATQLMASAPYLRPDGAGGFAAAGLPANVMPTALCTAILCSLPLGLIDARAALGGLVGAAALALVFRRWSVRRLGGHTGDTLGASEQLAQIGYLLGAAAWL
ncbi:MAG: adenosylcobinamide-GDP ribazoletransferase [Pseudomonadota bacterium]